VNRAELQQLADDRVRDAQALLMAGRWSGAYYLAGYAVECGLKSCVLAYVDRTGVIFEDKRFAEKCWTHSPDDLQKLAGLERPLGVAMAANAALAANWLKVKGWSEVSRYQQKAEADARELFGAITDAANGVLPWIRTHW